MVDFEGVVVVGVLVGPGLPEEVVAVNGRDDIHVIVTNVGVRGPRHIVNFLVLAQLGQDCLRVRLLDIGDVLHVSEEEVINPMRHVQGPNHILNAQSRVKVLVGMAADVEIAGHFLDSEITSQLASVSILEGCLSHLELSLLIGLMQQFEGPPLVDVLAIAIDAQLADRAQVGRVRHHGVLDIQRDDFAGEARKGDVQVDPEWKQKYFI